ncbi:MAG: prolyl oligopeptidase family serine peptidase [Verrucomicrobiota bacterium]|nr:prolyl oligopeptidase family serine peptidase [Verrucomicrobiota bacterium]
MTVAVLAAPKAGQGVVTVPPIPAGLREKVAPFFKPGVQRFHGWHPVKRRILVSAPDTDARQLLMVGQPMGVARQLTFGPEPVFEAAYQPEAGGQILLLREVAGVVGWRGMFRIRPELEKPVPILISDGRRPYDFPRWAPNGQQVAYLVDLLGSGGGELGILNPLAPLTARRIATLPGWNWTIEHWSPNSAMLLLREVVSGAENHLHLADAGTGVLSVITPRSSRKVRYGIARFAPGLDAVYYTSDVDSDFMQLCRLDLRTGIHKVLLPSLKWDLEALEISPNGKQAALVINEGGFGQVRLLDLKNLKLTPIPNLPRGRVRDLYWRANGIEFGFSVSAADSAGDVFSWDLLGSKLTRWTRRVSKAHGLPGIGAIRSFDGEIISLVYWLPDARRFSESSRRPVLLKLSSVPDGQMRPGHLGVHSYLIEKLGVAIVCPNLRGAGGYGNRHRKLDNGILRGHTLADLSAVLNWVRKQPQLDGERVALWGDGYGGSLALLAMSNFNSFVRCGVTTDPMENLLEYLREAPAGQKDRLRLEFGDVRNVKEREFLDRFSVIDAAGKTIDSIPSTSPVLLLGKAGRLEKALREKKKTGWVLEDSISPPRAREQQRFLAAVLFLQQHLFPHMR